MKTIFTLLCCMAFVTGSVANTFYISPNGNDNSGTGTSSNPWKSLFKATGAVTRVGDIIHVMAGKYTESVRSNLAAGVSIEGEGNSSVIQSTLSEQYVAIIIATSAEGTNGNQHISNITLDGNNLTTSWAIEIKGRSNFSIHDCSILNFNETGIYWSGRNDNNPGAPAVFATGNSFYNNKLTNCATYDGFGRGCLTIGGQEGMLIYNNQISQTGRALGKNGWPIKYCNDGYLKGCKIYNNQITKQAYDGITWDFAIELFNVSGLEIYGNTIVGAVDLNYQNKENYAYSVYIHNNIIGPEKLQARKESGIILEYSTETAIISNNQLKNLGVPIYFSCRSHSGVTDVTIKNNTCKNIGVANGSHEGFAVRFVSDGSNNHYIDNLLIDSNVFIANRDEKPYWGIGLLDAAKGDRITIRNNTIENFSAGCITVKPASVFDSLLIEHNTLSGNGNGNKPSLTGGTPSNYIFKNNTLSKSSVFTVTNFKMNIAKPFYEDLKNTTMLEFVAVIAGILSVWFSRKENIYVYPVGLINTIIYVFLSFDQGLLGEASVNFYYTVMSIYGWMLWSKRDKRKHRVVRVTSSSAKEWAMQLAFFAAFFLVIFFALSYLKSAFYPGVIPWADAFASATAFTGMWLMTKKKVESWYWWIATNIASIPLYFVKHFVFTSVYYIVLLVMAIAGLYEWKRRDIALN
jgi:nicotinamide mononucleotide transporter